MLGNSMKSQYMHLHPSYIKHFSTVLHIGCLKLSQGSGPTHSSRDVATMPVEKYFFKFQELYGRLDDLVGCIGGRRSVVARSCFGERHPDTPDSWTAYKSTLQIGWLRRIPQTRFIIGRPGTECAHPDGHHEGRQWGAPPHQRYEEILPSQPFGRLQRWIRRRVGTNIYITHVHNYTSTPNARIVPKELGSRLPCSEIYWQWYL